MFNKLLDELKEAEKNRRVVEVDFGEFFTTEFETKNPNTPNQTIQLSNGYELSRNAFQQMWKKIAYDVKGRKNAFAYHWQMPTVVAAEMPFHVQEQIAGRERSSKRKDNNVILNVHGNVITAVHSTNYTDYSNLALVEELSEYISNQGIEVVDYEYALDPYKDALELQILTEKRTPEDFGFFYGIGALIYNSQNGLTALHVMPFVKSTACNNSIVSMFGYHSRHIPNVTHVATEAIVNFKELTKLAKITYSNYMQLTNINVYDIEGAIDDVLKKYTIAKKYKKVVLKGLQSERTDIEDTLFNLVSGLTYAAQYVPEKHQSLGLIKSAGRLVDTLSAESEIDREIINKVI